MSSDAPSLRESPRAKAWTTRREKYGERGHSGSYRRPTDSLGRRALALVIRLHHEATLSEGQCCKALRLDRVDFRRLCDAASQKLTLDGASHTITTEPTDVS